ncbi:MAG: CBM96 family carbohydrate-binding protein [Nocardioidaceae bacterium]
MRRQMTRAGAAAAMVIAALAAVTPAAGAAVSTTVVADSYTDASLPTTNFGTRTYLRTDNSPVLRAYLKFSVSGYTPGTRATLRVYAESASSTGVSVRKVTDTTWKETTINAGNAPSVGPVLASSGAISSGRWVTLDVSSAVTGDGLVSLALTTPSSTAVRFTSREGVNKPQLLASSSTNSATTFQVSRTGTSTYRAASSTTVYTGGLKQVVESAVATLKAAGGGTVSFTSGDFDLGSGYFKLTSVRNITFAGAGMNATVVRNNSSAAADTEPFNFSGAFGVTVRDLTVSAGGPARTTSDALDFDQGNDVLVAGVKVTASRGRGIVFDGKNAGWTSERNVIRGCVISGVPSSGIEFLASSRNRVEGCTITDVGRYGVQLNKSSPLADQPNKKSSDNVLSGNVIDQAGLDGINLNGGDRNRIEGNRVTNSSDDASGRDGIRIGSTNSVSCNDNVVANNVATDTQAVKTQRYGLNVASSLCVATVVGPGNQFAGNRVKAINDLGTRTVYVSG